MATIFDLSENTAPDGTDRLYITDGTNDEGVQVANLLKGSGAEVPAAKITGTVAHENGGLEADVSAYDGLVQISGGSTSAIKNNWAASSEPTTGDDSGDGYVVGSRWIDTTNDKEYVCLDNSSGAAVWTETTGGGASYINPTVNAMGAQVGVSVGWAASTIQYDSQIDLGSQSTALNGGIGFSPDGLKFYAAESSNCRTYEYTLSTAFDLTTRTYVGAQDFSGSVPSGSFHVGPGGTKFYHVTGNAAIVEHTLSTAWSVSSYSSSSTTYLPSGGSTIYTWNWGQMCFGDSGNELYVSCRNSSNYITVKQYSMTTAYDLSTLSYTGEHVYSSNPGSLAGFCLHSDGTKIRVFGVSWSYFLEWTLTTAYDITTASSLSYVYDSFTPSSTLVVDMAPYRTADDGIAHWYSHGSRYVSIFDSGSATAAETTIDLSTDGVFQIEIQSEGCNLTFSNASAVQAFRLEVTNGNTGTITWPTSVDWASGSAPTLTTTGTDILEFFTRDSGTTWYGRVLVLNAS